MSSSWPLKQASQEVRDEGESGERRASGLRVPSHGAATKSGRTPFEQLQTGLAVASYFSRYLHRRAYLFLDGTQVG